MGTSTGFVPTSCDGPPPPPAGLPDWWTPPAPRRPPWFDEAIDRLDLDPDTADLARFAAERLLEAVEGVAPARRHAALDLLLRQAHARPWSMQTETLGGLLAALVACAVPCGLAS